LLHLGGDEVGLLHILSEDATTEAVIRVIRN